MSALQRFEVVFESIIDTVEKGEEDPAVIVELREIISMLQCLKRVTL